VPRTGPPGSRLGADVSDILRAWATLDGAAFENAYGSDPDRALAALGTMGVAQVAGIWAGLSPAFRKRLADRDPERVGTLAGVSTLDRDYANVKRLHGLYDAAAQRYRELAGHDGPRSFDGDPGMADAAARLNAFRLLRQRYSDGRRRRLDPPEYLTTLDTTGGGSPLVAVSVGDVSRATHVSYLVPGMNSSVAELPDYARAAKRIRDRKDDTAVVLWLNYVSPGPTEVPSNDRAREGAARLAANLAEQSASSAATRVMPRTTVIGHSYGSTLVTLALATQPHDVDSVVIVGSAGIPDGLTAFDLHVPAEQVFVSQADKDWLATFGQKTSGRANPENATWGAKLFGVDGAILPDGTVLEPAESHNAVGGSEAEDRRKYFGDRTESLRNIHRIMRGESVTEGSRNDPHLGLVYDR
jgi:pimeloyl-ACP methyl ester carboxylesterase